MQNDCFLLKLMRVCRVFHLPVESISALMLMVVSKRLHSAQ